MNLQYRPRVFSKPALLHTALVFLQKLCLKFISFIENGVIVVMDIFRNSKFISRALLIRRWHITQGFPLCPGIVAEVGVLDSKFRQVLSQAKRLENREIVRKYALEEFGFLGQPIQFLETVRPLKKGESKGQGYENLTWRNLDWLSCSDSLYQEFVR